MSLQKEQNLVKQLKNKSNIQVIQIITTTKNFEDRFEGSISYFFRSLKNGLYSFQGVSNRKYFKGISGVYFSLEESELFEIIIVYDTTERKLNKIQVIPRLKKLLGMKIQVNFGLFEEYEQRIREMIGIKSKTQTFGDYYKPNKSL